MKKILSLALLLSTVLSISMLSSCSDSPAPPTQNSKENISEEIIDPELAFYPMTTFTKDLLHHVKDTNLSRFC